MASIILLPIEVHNHLDELATFIDSEENFDIFEKPRQIEPLIEELRKISPFRYFAITMIQTQVSLVILFNFARWGSRSDFQLPPFNPSLHKYDRQAISMWVMLSSRYLGDWNHTNTEL